MLSGLIPPNKWRKWEPFFQTFCSLLPFLRDFLGFNQPQETEIGHSRKRRYTISRLRFICTGVFCENACDRGSVFHFLLGDANKIEANPAFVGATTFSIMTLGLKGLFSTFSIRDIWHNGTQHNNTLYRVLLCCLVMLSVVLSVAFHLLLCRVSLC